MYYSLYINHHYHHDYHRRRRHHHRHHRRFFTKIQKRITDPNDPQRRWILWIISKTGYFGYMIRSVSLLRIRKEWTLPAVTWNNFNTYIRFVTRPESWIKLWILSVLSRWQNRNTNRTCIVLGKNCYTTSPARLARLYFSNTYLISRLIFIWPVKSSILKLTVQNTRKDQQTCDLVRDSVEMEMNEKLSLFGYIVSFLNEKS